MKSRLDILHPDGSNETNKTSVKNQKIVVKNCLYMSLTRSKCEDSVLLLFFIVLYTVDNPCNLEISSSLI